MLNPSLNELKLVAESRGVKGYKSMSKEKTLSGLSKSGSVESANSLSKNSFDDKTLKKIREDFNELRERFLKPQIREIRKILYYIKNPKNHSTELHSTQKIKEIKESLFTLEERLSNFKKYCFQDDFKYRNIGDIRNLFNGVALNGIDENYYKPIRTKSAFNGNYIEYESKGDKDKNLSPKEYLDMIRPYLSDIINNHKTPKNLRVHSSNEVIDYETQFGEWKIQLTMSINFISSKDSDETRNMHTKSDNIEIMMGSETDDIIDELFNFFLQKYQEGLEESMRRSEFIFDSVDLLYYNLQKISLNRKGSSYIDSPKWLKNKKATINPKNNDNNCFQYALTVALNYQNIKKDTQRILKIKPFINQYNWKETDFPSEQKDWKKSELNKSIFLNILLALYNTEKIRLAYKSKYNFKRENK